MWKATWKGLLAHKLRLALTAVAIVLGVTFVSGTFVLTDTLHATFTTLFDNIYDHIDFVVRGDAQFGSGGSATRNPISDTIAASVRAVPGVAAAEGSVSGYARLIAPDGKAVTTGGAPTIGTSFNPDPQMSALQIVQGSPPVTSDQLVIDQATATKYGYRVGMRVRVLFAGPPRTFTLVGIAKFGTADNLAGASLAVFDLRTSQVVFDQPGTYDEIDVVARPGADLTTVQAGIAAALPKGVQVVTGKTVADEQSNALNQALGFFSTALLVFAFISLFVGGFTIFNTFSILVGQRTRELALLRVLGASRRQVFRSVLAEAAIVGLVASLVGLGLGVLTASGLEALLRGLGIDLPTSALVFKARTAVVALAVGVGVTVVASISPARRAVRIAPVAALTDASAGEGVSSRRRFVVGSLVGAAGVAALGFGLADKAIELVGLGAVAVFIGAGMLAPLIARSVSGAIGLPIARLVGMPGRLGRQNSMRSPRRTASTAAALMVGLALVSTMAVFGASIAQSATSSIEQAISADFVVSSPGGNGEFSLSAADAARAVPGVSDVSTVFVGQFEFRGAIDAIGAYAAVHGPSTIILHVASGQGLGALAAGKLLVDTTTADDNRLHVGSVVDVRFAKTGATRLTVGGIYQPNALLGGFLVGEAFFLSHFEDPLPLALLVNYAGGATPAGQQAIEAGLAAYPGLKVQTQAEFIQTQKQQVNDLLGVVYALLALAVLIALIGIVNTLMLSVFERTHEIGLLRAVGMRRRQVRSMIRTESVIISLFGALLGTVIGAGLGMALSSSLSQQGITQVVVPFGSLVVFLVIAALCGLGAASWPARKAAKLDVLAAIASD